MTRIIAKKERTEMMRDGRFRLAAGLVGGLLLVALVLGAIESHNVRAEAERAEEASWAQWVEQGEKNPHSAAHFALYTYRPVSALAFAEPGVTPYTGLAVWLEAHYQNEFAFRPARDAAGVGRLGQVTAVTVLQVLLPLVIVLLAFGAFASERERGTLQQSLAQGVRPRDLTLGKALGVAQALAVVLVPAIVVGVLALLLTSGSLTLGDGLARFGLLALAYGLYLAAFVGVALAVSARSRTGRGALVGLLTFWALAVLVFPRVAADAARALYPTPSTTAFWSAVNEDLADGIDGHDPSDERAERLLQETMEDYGVSAIEDLPINFSGVSLQAMEEYSDAVYDKQYGALWAQVEQQNRAQALTGLVTPLMAVRSASMGLAGTDFAAHRHFAESAETYRRQLVKAMNDDLMTLTDPIYERNVRGSDFWAAQERFSYAPPSAAWAARQQALPLALLALWALGGLSLAILAARRPRFL
ncbi:MAG: DUF3526 domain-containing protein [Bacteroidota bacterium]